MAQGGVPSWWWPNEQYGLRVADDGTIDLIALNGVVALSISPTGVLSGAGLQFHDVADPTSALDVANKEYVDTHGGGGGGSGATGATGAQGGTGPPGSPGGAGATGSTGPAGSSGGVGATGSTGPGGAAGGAGATGSTGPGGATGSAGATGATGPNWEGWTQDANNPADVSSNGGELILGSGPMTATFDEYGNLVLSPNNSGDSSGGLQITRFPFVPGGAIESDGNGLLLYGLPGMAVPIAWQANTFYPSGSYTRPTVENGHGYTTFSDGTSGGTQPPTWPTDGSSITDGTITWHDAGLYTLSPVVQVFGVPGMGTGFIPKAQILTVWKDNAGAPRAWSIGPTGEEQIWAGTEPDDADVATSSRSQYYDDTVGAPKLWIKERDSAGTLFKKIAAALNSDGSLDMKSEQIHNVTDPTSAQDAATQAYVLAHVGAGATGATGPQGTTGGTGGAGATGSTGPSGGAGGTGGTGATGATGGKAAGQLFLSGAGMWPSIAAGCKPNSQYQTPTNNENVWTLDFVDGSTTSCEATIAMPSDWNGGTITATFLWMANDGTTNAVVWGLQAYAYADGVALDQAWGAQQTVTQANASTAYQVHISTATSALTVGGSPAASDLVQFRVQRLGANGSDTMTADAKLLGVMITYTRS